ncbi:Predicted outer membrane protein [Neorhodopirellula lusitana]|uniref:Predicted outer membrane protein n=1 Tax=Neorhodopirellula lusitana TaxID=445327 RepID=A0ABY1QD11_9BACT|nr:DUF4142 domain-containing protein [Neorhodopirellula lusitana]SMP64455.1 Predicted outer membrane protein [Neorhodopirellula lusitana]
MSKIRFTFASLAIAGICGLPTVQAQQTLPGQATDPAQNELLRDQPATQPGQSQNNQRDRYEARRVSTDSRNQQGPTVKEAIVQKLEKANKAEVELANFAMQRTDNQEVKQLAQTIAQDHESCNQKLKQMAGQHHQNGQSHQGQQNRAVNNHQAGQTATSRQQATVPMELCQIAEQACDNALQMTKEMLGNHEGQDFDMAFLGQQCVAHTMMLAELKAIESTGPQELQQVAQEASQKVKQHLDHCKQLAKKLEDDRKNNRS